jgi:hypothetical protein
MKAVDELPREVAVIVENMRTDKLKQSATKKRESACRVRSNRSLSERLAAVVGKAENLPSDMSINHDHYLYGLPQRE